MVLIRAKISFNLPLRASTNALSFFSKNKPMAVQKRMQQFIEAMPNKTDIKMYPIDIAFIMGHPKVVNKLLRIPTLKPLGSFQAISTLVVALILVPLGFFNLKGHILIEYIDLHLLPPAMRLLKKESLDAVNQSSRRSIKPLVFRKNTG